MRVFESCYRQCSKTRPRRPPRRRLGAGRCSSARRNVYSARIVGEGLGGPISRSRRAWAPLGGLGRVWARDFFIFYFFIFVFHLTGIWGQKLITQNLKHSLNFASPSLLQFLSTQSPLLPFPATRNYTATIKTSQIKPPIIKRRRSQL